MDIRITMPDLAATGSAMRVIRWLVKPGDHVSRGAVLLEVETDKANMEVESTAAGIVLEIALEPGAEVQAGDLMAVIRPPGSTTARDE